MTTPLQNNPFDSVPVNQSPPPPPTPPQQTKENPFLGGGATPTETNPNITPPPNPFTQDETSTISETQPTPVYPNGAINMQTQGGFPPQDTQQMQPQQMQPQQMQPQQMQPQQMQPQQMQPQQMQPQQMQPPMQPPMQPQMQPPMQPQMQQMPTQVATGFAMPIQATPVNNNGMGMGVQFQQPNQFHQTTPPPAPNMPGGQTNRKYNIIDLYWLVSKKIYLNMGFNPGEASFLSIGFNANFNNMRLSLAALNPNDLNGPSIIMSNMQKMTTANLYSEGAAELLANKSNGQTIRLYERVINGSNSWTPNLTTISWHEDHILLNTQDQQGAQYSFIFLGSHIHVFESALNFMIEGSSWNASLLSM